MKVLQCLRKNINVVKSALLLVKSLLFEIQVTELMKQEVGNVAWLPCKHHLFSFKYDREMKVFIYASKMLESQSKQNKMHLHKLCMSKIQIWGKLHLKCSYFFLYQHGLCSIHY